MNKFTFFLCLLLFSISTAIAQAPQRTIDSQFNAWYMYFGTYKVADKLSLHGELQVRRHGWFEDAQQLLTRVGLNYHMHNNLMLTGGYAYIVTHPYGEQPVDEKFSEHRIWEQLILKHTQGKIDFNHRYRLEQRWVESSAVGEQDFSYSNRARYRFMFNIPLTGPQLNKGSLFISLYDEVFVNFGQNIRVNIFDQNRIYGALGYQTGASSNIQVGYLNQYIQKSDGLRFEINHTFQVSYTQNLEFN